MTTSRYTKKLLISIISWTSGTNLSLEMVLLTTCFTELIFQEIQYFALQLAKKGVIVGLCSKNNPEDVNHVLENHPDMVLRNNDITIKKVNWDNKISNLQSIAKDLNVPVKDVMEMEKRMNNYDLAIEEKDEENFSPSLYN